ncbi:glycosyltransferase [Candidatus Thorarchaeota archaeon]|nr:MAG: glycosyltransferase [Candidatus Thorarchaeota archaeon]
MTDDTGIFQHAKSSIADRREGYTTDDNARALIVALKYHRLSGDEQALTLARTYLSFLLHMQKADGRVHNFLGYNRSFLDEAGSEDSLGRILWACGYSQEALISDDLRMIAREIFDKSLVWASRSGSPRTHAFAILGLYHYAKVFPQDKNPLMNVIHLADRLCEAYRHESTESWHWFEPILTYANARLPHALFRAYQITGKQDYLLIAEKTFEFLTSTVIINGTFKPVGNRSWMKRGGKKALYDQQPIEASCMVEAASIAFEVTGKEQYAIIARIAFDWFMGKNTKKIMVYNPATGGCFDGVTPDGLNRNQGAESGLAYLLARLEMETLNKNAPKRLHGDEELT